MVFLWNMPEDCINEILCHGSYVTRLMLLYCSKKIAIKPPVEKLPTDQLLFEVLRECSISIYNYYNTNAFHVVWMILFKRHRVLAYLAGNGEVPSSFLMLLLEKWAKYWTNEQLAIVTEFAVFDRSLSEVRSIVRSLPAKFTEIENTSWLRQSITERKRLITADDLEEVSKLFPSIRQTVDLSTVNFWPYRRGIVDQSLAGWGCLRYLIQFGYEDLYITQYEQFHVQLTQLDPAPTRDLYEFRQSQVLTAFRYGNIKILHHLRALFETQFVRSCRYQQWTEELTWTHDNLSTAMVEELLPIARGHILLVTPPFMSRDAMIAAERLILLGCKFNVKIIEAVYGSYIAHHFFSGIKRIPNLDYMIRNIVRSRIVDANLEEVRKFFARIFGPSSRGGGVARRRRLKIVEDMIDTLEARSRSNTRRGVFAAEKLAALRGILAN